MTFSIRVFPNTLGPQKVTLNFCPLHMTLPRALMGSGHLDLLTTQVSSSVHREGIFCQPFFSAHPSQASSFPLTSITENRTKSSSVWLLLSLADPGSSYGLVQSHTHWEPQVQEKNSTNALSCILYIMSSFLQQEPPAHWETPSPDTVIDQDQLCGTHIVALNKTHSRCPNPFHQ